MRHITGRRRAAATAAVALTVLVGGGCTSKPKPDRTAADFAREWSRGDYAAMAALTDASDRAAVTAAHEQAAKDLGATAIEIKVTRVDSKDTAATASYTATVTLADFGQWSYDGSFRLVRADKKWRITWEPSVIHPQLQADQRFARTRKLPARGAVLDAARKPLFTQQPTVTVVIEPRRFTDPKRSLKVLAETTGVDRAALARKVAAAKPTAAVEVITLRRAAYEKIKPAIYALPGVTFPTGTALLAPSPTFARALLGRVGPATAEQLEKAGPAFKPGDVLGLGGVQGAYQERLTGAPSGTIVLKTGDEVDATLHEFPGKPGEPVRTTLDRRVQEAAEAALDGGRSRVRRPRGADAEPPAALVAVRVSTGEVLAVANRPSSLAYNRAFEGRYPPGSTFKVVTTAALLRSGLKQTEVVPCPKTKSVGGKSFRNFEGESAGRVPFSTDFAHSCNTAFVSLTSRLEADSLVETARSFGIGPEWSTGLPAYTGQVPPAKDQTELAASMIGQGRVLASPLGMASATAAVADGTWRSPVLVTSPSAGEQQTTPLDAGVAKALRALMREVVTDGTGKRAAVRGRRVHGKTGTAEFGTKTPLKTHAWFVGFSGDVAVAVLVEGGRTSRVGGQDAAPIASRFFAAI